MSTKEELRDLMNKYSGGSDARYRHWANRLFIYSEGVKVCADEAGFHWLLDIVATEVAPICLNLWHKDEEHLTFLKLLVTDSKARIWVEQDVGEPKLWSRDLEFTSFPDGDWTFYMGIDTSLDPTRAVLVMYLPHEH